jgi:hypothetical protein
MSFKLTNSLSSLLSFSFAGALLFVGSSVAQSIDKVDDTRFLLAIEQGYSLYRDGTRFPLFSPFTWVDKVCLERSGERQAGVVKSFFDLTTSITGRLTRLEIVDSLIDCSPDASMTISFSRSLAEVKSKIATVDELFQLYQKFDGTRQVEFVGFASIDSILKAALVVVNWNNENSDEWNSSILVQELFQAYLGGNDVPWQGDYFSLLHEVNPFPDMNGPVPYSLAWKRQKFRVNPAGLCPVDVFAMSAIAQYMAEVTESIVRDGPTSRGLINFSWDQREPLRRDVAKVQSEFARFELVLDEKCW